MCYMLLLLFVFLNLYVVLLLFYDAEIILMGLPVQPNTNPFDFFEKVALDGARAKDNCLAPNHKNETSIPRSYPIQKLSSVVIDMENTIKIQLEHDLEYFEVFFFNRGVLWILCGVLIDLIYLTYNYYASKYIF